MKKAKRILLIITIISCISFPSFAVDQDDYEELDYVWLEEEINEEGKSIIEYALYAVGNSYHIKPIKVFSVLLVSQNMVSLKRKH